MVDAFVELTREGAGLPEGGRAEQWVGGVVAAVLPIIVGIGTIARGVAVFPFGVGGRNLFGSHHPHATLNGSSATAIGIVYICLGLLLHFHFFWGISRKLDRYATIAKTATLIVLIPSLIYALLNGFR